MIQLHLAMESAVNSADPNELAILARVILDAAIAGDMTALKFVLECGLKEAEKERFQALRSALGLTKEPF